MLCGFKPMCGRGIYCVPPLRAQRGELVGAGEPWQTRIEFPNDIGDIVMISGVRFATATLWTYLNAVGRMEAARFPDFIKIQGASVDRWNNLHRAQLNFLEQAKADVIVTHHAPVPGSVHEDFQGDALNTFFVNNLDPERFPKTKLWIHGHVHTSFDYSVPAGDHSIRVVCNPLGYPMSRFRRRVGVKVVELPT